VNYRNIPPRIVDSRWASSITSIRYHKYMLNKLRLFWEAEQLNDKTNYEDLDILLAFLDWIFQDITQTIMFCQAFQSVIHKLFYKIKALLDFYGTTITFANCNPSVKAKLEHFNGNTKKEWMSIFNKIRAKILAELQAKFDITSNHYCFFENIANLDVTNEHKASRYQMAFASVPWIEIFDCNEKNLMGLEYKEYLVQSLQYHNRSDIDSLEYWIKNSEKFPHLSKFAIQCLNVPSGSCDVERSFSQYSWICGDSQRNNMSSATKSLRMMAVFNKQTILEARNMAFSN
jgi:hAT family protein